MKRLRWADLDDSQRSAALARPASSRSDALRGQVSDIIAQVRQRGDAAVRDYSLQFDGVQLETLRVPASQLQMAWSNLRADVQQAIDLAIDRIETFHRACMADDVRVSMGDGVVCERVSRPVGSVGLYVPAGSAPLPSTTLMLGVPARLAGCPNIVLCSPPGADGQVDATVLAAAARLGIGQVFAIGGAQAVAAMAFGSDTVPSCDKIFGPGNAWVTEAKLQVAQEPQGAALDMPAGPSEVMVVADASANPQFVASDLLSQAEHGPDSQVVLVALDAELIDTVAECVRHQAAQLPRAAIVEKALAHARSIAVSGRDEAIEVINRYAPEHLILEVDSARHWLPAITAAGSIFLGHLTPESLGDYCSGTNHVLPTYGYARNYSGLSVASFQTRMTVQEASADGLRAIGPTAVTLANVEGLAAHARAVTLRLESLQPQLQPQPRVNAS